MPPFALILPAAGKSTRFGGKRSKLLTLLAGRPVLARALDPFLEHPDLATVVIAAADPAEMGDVVREALGRTDDRIHFCVGGSCRAESVRAALATVPAGIEWVAVHDAARPLISRGLIESTLAAAYRYGAAVPALPAALTIKQAVGPLPAKVQRTLPRHELWTMQTPQIMRRADLLDAFGRCPLPLDLVTDDVQLLELAGREVWLVPGEDRNIKVTTATDVPIAEMWLGK
jgi:2-C-methyl-D-erythritol 4-phosphate cytidylyltransferase